MNEKLGCTSCFSHNLNIFKTTLRYFPDLSIHCADLQCVDCGAKMVGYFELKKVIQNRCD